MNRSIACLLLPSLLAATLTSHSTRADSPAAQSDLEEVIVTAFRRQYKELEDSTALGLTANALEIPLSTMAITQDILEDQQVNNVEDALRNVAGVTRFKQGNGGEEKFSIRGFDVSQSLYKDGARLNNRYNATNIATTETGNIERYDVLKGPAAILYGQGEPGGVINYISKKPLDREHRTVEVIGGTDEYLRAEADTTGPITDALAYRAVLTHEDSGSYRDEIERRRTLVSPSLSWQITDSLRATVLGEYIQDQYTQDRGQALEADGAGSYRYSSRISPEDFLGVPGWNDRTESDYRRAYANLSWDVSERWTLEALGSYTRVDKDLYDSSPRVIPATGPIQISPSFQGGRGTQSYGKLSSTFTLGSNAGWEHRLLASVSREDVENDGRSYSANQRVTFTPETGQYGGLDFAIDYANPFPLTTDVTEVVTTLQTLSSYQERWYVLAGVGYNQFEDGESGLEQSELSPRAGVLWRVAPAVSLYTSYGRGFVPTDAEDQNGAVLDPEKTEQYELGAKADLFGGQAQLSGAVFETYKRDVAYTDPASLDLPPEQQWSRSLGETRTRGAEAQFVGEPVAGLRVITGYTYLDNEITKGDPVSGDTGNRLPGIPRHSGSVWGVYEVTDGVLRGFGLGAGVFAQSEVYIGLENLATYAGWTQVDASAYYKRDHWKVQLNARNVFDREYYLTQALANESLASVRVGTAAPRSVLLSIAWDLSPPR